MLREVVEIGATVVATALFISAMAIVASVVVVLLHGG